MAKKKNKNLLIGLLALVVIADVLLATTGIIPVLGDATAIVGNLVTEVAELALIFGLMTK